MNTSFCDCKGCIIGSPCCANQPEFVSPERLRELDSYVEARFNLIEELFAQMLGLFPPEAAEALSNGYNQRRAGIILHFKPESDAAKAIIAAEEAAKAKAQPSLVLVPSSKLIVPN